MLSRAMRNARHVAAAAAAAAVITAPAFVPVHAAASMFELSEADAMSKDEVHYPREKVYTYTKEFVEKDYEDSSMLWRHARAAYQLSQVAGTPSDAKKALLDEAMSNIKTAVQYDGNNSDARRWYGTILQAHSGFQGYQQQIKDAFEVKSQWEQAVTLNPDDATAQHLLGRWCLTVADMPWYQRSLAATLFAEPPSSSYDEAREFFAAAERISPDFWKANQYYLAVIEDRLGNRDQAVRWAAKATSLPVASAGDRDYQEKALALLKSWDTAAYTKAKAADDKRKEVEAMLAE
ncbi:RMDN1 [Symbiodinium sp. KB8]|nr:RMDN1 [Symbiodinium sp. KB8]